MEARIRPRTRGVLLVHYFGFPADIGAFKDICRRRNLLLLEDCAHVLKGTQEDSALGAIGDASVFSWRKFLPMYDGATLVVNHARQDYRIRWNRRSRRFDLKAAVNLLDQAVRARHYFLLSSLYRAVQPARSLLAHRVENVRTTPMSLTVNMNSVAFESQLVNLPMSALSHWVLDHANIPWIKSQRVRNYRCLAETIQGVPNATPLSPHLSPEICPWIFPLVLDGAPGMHARLRKAGIPAVSWSGVRHPAIPRGTYEEADFLYENLIFLPVHQNLDEKDIAGMAQATREILLKAGPQSRIQGN